MWVDQAEQQRLFLLKWQDLRASNQLLYYDRMPMGCTVTSTYNNTWRPDCGLDYGDVLWSWHQGICIGSFESLACMGQTCSACPTNAWSDWDMGHLEAMPMPRALCHVPHTIPEQCSVTMHIVLLEEQERGVYLVWDGVWKGGACQMASRGMPPLRILCRNCYKIINVIHFTCQPFSMFWLIDDHIHMCSCLIEISWC